MLKTELSVTSDKAAILSIFSFNACMNAKLAKKTDRKEKYHENCGRRVHADTVAQTRGQVGHTSKCTWSNTCAMLRVSATRPLKFKATIFRPNHAGTCVPALSRIIAKKTQMHKNVQMVVCAARERWEIHCAPPAEVKTHHTQSQRKTCEA